MDDFITLVPKKYTVKKRLNIIKENEIVFRHGHIAITNYRMGDNTEFEKSLSTWDRVAFRYHLIGGYYVKELREFRINRGYDTKLLSQFFPHHKARVDNDAYPADKIQVELYTPPRSDIQTVALSFMASQGEYKRNAKYTQQIINMDTGEGKSWCGVASTAFLSARTVIIVPFSKLLEQWRGSYINFTSVSDDEILIVKGRNVCRKILDGKYKDVKVFIFMIDTLTSFQKTYGNMETIELLRATNAYTKIVDEVHRDMKAISMVEALSNFRMNYYMSASAGRSERKENWMFNTLFRNVPRFGQAFKTQDEKHINVMIKRYTFIPNNQQIRSMVSPRVGLNSRLYEKELVSAPPFQRKSFDDSMRVMLKWSKGLLKDGNKILILANTIAFITYIKEIAEEFFPGDVSLYHGSLKPAEKEKALKSTVICATSSSLGTGADIKGIQHVYNCATYANWIDATQLPGRARKLDDPTVQVVYCELVNFGYQKTYRQYEKRRPFLINKSKTGKLMIVS